MEDSIGPQQEQKTPQRNKTWEELNDQQKTEKLKRELQRTQRQVMDLCGYVKVLLKHEHSGNKIVQPITYSSCEEESGSLWFRVDEFK